MAMKESGRKDDSEPHVVLIVNRPRGWKPKSVDDIPPNVDRREMRSPLMAAVFVQGFNSEELQESTGTWAIR